MNSVEIRNLVRKNSELLLRLQELKIDKNQINAVIVALESKIADYTEDLMDAEKGLAQLTLEENELLCKIQEIQELIQTIPPNESEKL